MDTAILLISCRDQKGITAAVTNFIYQYQGNIEHADQHIDSQSNVFFMRIEWSLKGFALAKPKIIAKFAPLAKKFKMDYSLYFSAETSRMAIFVSEVTHCLYDLLLKFKEKQLFCQIPLIISNHSQAKKIAEDFNIKFFFSQKNPQNKLSAEKKEIAILRKEKIDFIALARYGQIFTRQFVKAYHTRIINIHHSFLPAFAGSNPYRQAYSRGVKIIGATSHYVTEKLDAGPIIEQDIVRVSHRDCLEDLRFKGQDLERTVFSRAVRWHLEHKILVYGNKTVVFD
ncbi:MAG: formyltetrahydrofolate deformylase [Candidatus Omnitrophica bacterium]|nr:formyltetrahydrofolate deformylase [Candidatus Omnitrophota bacterium]MBU2251352.1 formyltetrahydrofolate deformylase [Candidatus Omnitrophota bacterium]MBU2474079.1 formyltetrahydrofolate deformylase [Candidatus Omnitrophota bacterium]